MRERRRGLGFSRGVRPSPPLVFIVTALFRALKPIVAMLRHFNSTCKRRDRSLRGRSVEERPLPADPTHS
jgi:hypothetical protein